MDFSSTKVLYRVLTLKEELILELTTEGPHEIIYALGYITVLDKNGHYSIVMTKRELKEVFTRQTQHKIIRIRRTK